MKTYSRTTISIPRDVLSQVRVEAALENKSVSAYIADFLRTGVRPGTKRAGAALPIGKYRMAARKKFSRQALYESYLRKKIPA